MEEVEFHTGLADPLDHAARLLRKALRQGGRVCVATPQIDALARHLWSFEARDFLPHARPGVAPAVWRRSPVWLLPSFESTEGGGDRPGTWVNLGAGAPARLEGCERLIELVAADVAEVEAGRLRWRDYKARGLVPVVRFEAR